MIRIVSYFAHGAGVDEVGTCGRLVASLLTRLRLLTERGYTEFFCRVSPLGSVVGSSVGGGGTG